MVMSSNGKKIRVIDPLWGKSTGDWLIPFTKAGNSVIWCFLSCEPEQTVEQTVGMLVIWVVIAFIMILQYCDVIER